MIPNLTGKIALITGAGSGLGQAIAEGLAEHGAELILVGRRENKLESTRRAILSKGGKARVYAADVSRIEEVERLKAAIFQEAGAPSIVVNAAGMYGEIQPIRDSDPALWIQTLLTNTAGPYLISRAFVGEMIRAGWGRIVNLSSAASLAGPNPKNSAYAVSKAALNLFTRQLAAEVEGTGVTANVMHPGEVKTEMFEFIKEASAKEGDMAGWVKRVEETGGDSPEKTVQLILELTGPGSEQVNGRFLWIRNGLKEPLPSWD
jgi:NAD(P)-dependent dehydrogenase (short-subunit alcohol dehydrogenase family)